jgi:hypothetical protein
LYRRVEFFSEKKRGGKEKRGKWKERLDRNKGERDEGKAGGGGEMRAGEEG